MRTILKIKSIVTFLILYFLVAGLLFPQERFFDTAEQTSNQVRLTIFYPSMGSIKALNNLRDIGFLQIENLLVIGVYHQKERTEYQRSIDYARENNLDWLKFHQLTADLNRETLFQKNALTEDFERIFSMSDGIIFFGGADIPPYIYNKKSNLMTRITTPYRSFLETSFIFHLLGGLQDKNFKPLLDSNPQFPILGICLGCQSLNVGTGGTLIQDIWLKKYKKKTLEDVIALGKNRWHTNPYNRLYPEEKLIPYNMHQVKLSKSGKFVKELGFSDDNKPYIISAHHQMAGKLGKGMKVIAWSLDGKVPEAIEHEKFNNVLGVQFHPEFPILYDRERTFRFTPQDSEGISLITILENNPPSYEFEKKIWGWFCAKITAYHNSKR